MKRRICYFLYLSAKIFSQTFMLKLSISYPQNNTQKKFEIEDIHKIASLYEMRLAQTFEGEKISPEFEGYLFKITGGSDKCGFPMMQGVLTSNRVRLIHRKGMINFKPAKKGQVKRKAVRGCIIGPETSVLDVIIVKKGTKEIEGVTDKKNLPLYGPKRASRIRKLFSLGPKDNVMEYRVPHIVFKKGKEIKRYPKVTKYVTKRILKERAEIKKQRETKKEKQKEKGRLFLEKQKLIK